MTIAEHSEADAKSMFLRGDDGRIAFYPHLYGYGYWLDGEGRQAALLAAARNADRLSMILVVAIFGMLFLGNYLLPPVLRPLPWLAWLPAMAAAAAFCNRRVTPHLAGLTRTAQRKFLLSRRSVAAMQSMSRLLFVLSASGLAAVFGVYQFILGDKPSVAIAIAAGFGGVSLWAALIIQAKQGMRRAVDSSQ
jgi:hypothetical protein